MGAELLVETLAALAAGSAQPKPQDHTLATLAPILTREDGRIDFTRDAQSICNRFRGFQPWPGAFTTFRGKQLTLHGISPAAERFSLAGGELSIAGEQLIAGCGAGSAIVIDELQLEGKRRMKAREFINGYQPKAQEKLGS
jgi:methionyl-tRNA formyltransferase